MSVVLERTFFSKLQGLYQPAPPVGFENPSLLHFNHALSKTLGVEDWESQASEYFSGNRLIAGSEPIALAYAGHQFGSLNPQLGDGRAVLLGELVAPDGQRYDLQLKGSGPTVFSRGGDGRAGLGPILRETLVSEAMFYLGIKTTRVLAAVATGDWVYREERLPGAVLCRVAKSHIRIGTVEFVAIRGQRDLLTQLVDYTLERHYPEAKSGSFPALDLLRAVAKAQAELIASWMLVGFVHGVMNTDNMALSGETIDYGPCAFMDVYNQNASFSSIDRGGRYMYKNQPLIGKWNLARLAESLLPLLADSEQAAVEAAQAALEEYHAHYNAQLLAGMRRKLGLLESWDSDQELVSEFLSFLEESGSDFTQSFRTMAHDMRHYGEPQWGPMGQELAARYVARLKSEPGSRVAERMDKANPAYIPRNHRVEEVLKAAHAGDLGPFKTYLDVLRSPFVEQPEYEKYLDKAPESFGPYRTFCGT